MYVLPRAFLKIPRSLEISQDFSVFLLYHSSALKTYISAVIEEKGQTIKQYILILSSRIYSLRPVYAALAEHGIPSIIITDKQELFPMLYPAFLWLDLRSL